MKNGSKYAKLVKRFFAQLKQRHGKPTEPDATDPLDQLIAALLAADASESKAAVAAKRLREAMVDVNEVRVSTNAEVAAVIKPHISDGNGRAAAIRDALNSIFRRENAVTLESLRKMGRREARQYLVELDGVDSYAAASVMLWSLGAHAIPVNGRLYAALQKAQLVDASASVDEVQAFLERNIQAADAKDFCLLMERHASSKSSRSGGNSPAATGTARKTANPSKTGKRAAGGGKRSRRTQSPGAAR